MGYDEDLKCARGAETMLMSEKQTNLFAYYVYSHLIGNGKLLESETERCSKRMIVYCAI